MENKILKNNFFVKIFRFILSIKSDVETNNKDFEEARLNILTSRKLLKLRMKALHKSK